MATTTKQVVIVGTMTFEDGGAAQPPLGIWGGGNVPYPTPPIAPGGPPLGIWGGAPPPYPAHPIAPGGPPPGIWGGGNVPYPTPPIYYPPLGIWGGGNVPYPTPPIHIPGSPPLRIWGPTDPRPGNLPVMPGDGGGSPPEGENPPGWDWAYSPFYGWVVVPGGGGGKPQPPGPGDGGGEAPPAAAQLPA